MRNEVEHPLVDTGGTGLSAGGCGTGIRLFAPNLPCVGPAPERSFRPAGGLSNIVLSHRLTTG